MQGNVADTFLNAMGLIPLLGDSSKVVRVVAKYLDWLPDLRLILRDWLRKQFANAASVLDDVLGVVIKQCDNSFSAGTLVSTKDGLRPIATIEQGNMVWAWDEGTGTTGLYTVTATIAHTDPTQVHLTVNGEQVETTP